MHSADASTTATTSSSYIGLAAQPGRVAAVAEPPTPPTPPVVLDLADVAFDAGGDTQRSGAANVAGPAGRFARGRLRVRGGGGEEPVGVKLTLRRAAAPRGEATNGGGAPRGVMEEVARIAACRHKYVLQLYGVMEPDQDPYYVVYELATLGSLLDYYKQQPSPGSVLLSVRLNFLLQIAGAMAFLHSRGILHRNLKSSNIFINRNSTTQLLEAKIGDFGLARINQPFLNDLALQDMMWIAPELLQLPPLLGQFSNATDVFSFGVLMTEVVSFVGVYGYPWSRLSDENMESCLRVLGSKSHERAKYLEGRAHDIFRGTPLAEQFKSCVQYDAAERPSFAELEAHIIEIAAQN
ncbi:hypothetical protein HK405_012305, partial [Cladochytrium tenue]